MNWPLGFASIGFEPTENLLDENAGGSPICTVRERFVKKTCIRVRALMRR
jgi:hypothetical protein